MSYYSDKKSIKETTKNKIVATAAHEVGAEIIVKALNYYFGNTHTSNQAIEMMNRNTANSLKLIVNVAKKQDMDSHELIEFLLETSEEMAAQALVVSMRDELKYTSPIE